MIALDKQLHFLGCFAIAAAIYAAIHVLWIAVLVSIAIGLAKEVLDSQKPKNYFSWLDLAADIAGACSFALWVYLCSLLGV